ncbi:hypothetical protein Tco_0974552 [Tanacetum coccineum]|uniref:Integrase, catalytic region, zinc finger, CCHC-type, peptidase aspartic, catalytic n=1 Tax=Tanacetum coccineum TaxID=301880 RepID=A0ABQ5EBW0_9ASTR
MDPMISLGQKNTLAEYMILSGADNRPPMLDKDLYDSWKSRMELYMQNREHRRMILESVEHADCYMKATNIILQGLPADIYSLVNHHRVAKDLWERVQLLMQGTSLTKQERECKLYDAFDKFTHIKGESLHTYYLQFTQLINDMNIYKMNMEQFQVNTKFLNSLPPEWNLGFAILVFSLGDDPIACLNKAMDFLMAIASSRFPTTNNQLRTSSNSRNQATIQDGRVTVQQVQGRQGQNYSGTTYKGNATSSREIRQADMQELLNATIAKMKDIWLGNALSLSDQGMQHDPGIPASQAQTVIPHNAAFQTEDLDIYDSDCDDLSTA